jgi:flagellin-like protein
MRRRRSTARRNRRGVSPIIATILLVAITVALAATLYVLLIPLISHTSTTPLSGNLAWGTTTPKTGTPGNPGCASGHYCWQVSISTATSGAPPPSSLNLYVQNGSGLTISTSAWTFAFLTSTNSVAASAVGPTAGTSGAGWTGNGTSNVLTLAMYLWIDTGSPTPYSGQSISLYTVGVNGFSGSFSNPLAT